MSRGTAVVRRVPARRVKAVMRALARAIDGLELPAVEKISESQDENPFQVLIATLLSARTQDQTTLAASTRLFKVARTPRTMAALPVRELERLIYPVSFYRNKARHVKACCEMLVMRFGGGIGTPLAGDLCAPSATVVLFGALGIALGRWLRGALVGAFALHNALGDVVVAAVFGVLGYLMMRFDYPRITLVIALVLGELAERSFHQALALADGAWTVFFTRHVSLILSILVGLALCWPVLRHLLQRLKKGRAA